ncbi:hypothetical protein [Nonomuraea sp. NPDC050540]|uniref:hypothetical protein n=1 Tax=Nonomuraea sp. NPDC050540 TaxID=3364367 RepID=UPI0037920087
MSGRELHAIEGGATEEKRVRSFSGDDESVDIDELDELIEASSLGSPAAKQIRSLTSDEEVERFGGRLRSASPAPPPASLEAEANPDAEITTPELDVDDAILALVRMVRILGDGPDRQYPEAQSVNGLDVGSENFRMGLRTSSQLGDYISCMAGFTLRMTGTPVIYGNGMHTVMLLAAQPGGPARLLRYLLDHQVLIHVRDDIARSIVWITFADFDNAPLAVRHACAAVLHGTSFTEGLIDEFTRAALAHPRELEAAQPLALHPAANSKTEKPSSSPHPPQESAGHRDAVRMVFPAHSGRRRRKGRRSCPAEDPLTIGAGAIHSLAMFAGVPTWGYPELCSHQHRPGCLSTAGEGGNSARVFAGVLSLSGLVLVIALVAVVSVSLR